MLPNFFPKILENHGQFCKSHFAKAFTKYAASVVTNTSIKNNDYNRQPKITIHTRKLQKYFKVYDQVIFLVLFQVLGGKKKLNLELSIHTQSLYLTHYGATILVDNQLWVTYYNPSHNFWNFTIFQYRSDSPQVKGNLILSIANLLYELSHELPNNLRLRILRNQEILEKDQIWMGTQPSAQSPYSLVPSFPQTLRIAVKKHAKPDTKLFFSCPVSLDYSILFQIFRPGLQCSGSAGKNFYGCSHWTLQKGLEPLPGHPPQSTIRLACSKINVFHARCQHFGLHKNASNVS